MHAHRRLLVVASLLRLALAWPADRAPSVPVRPRCGQQLVSNQVFLLDEANPDAVHNVTPSRIFEVAQAVNTTNRIRTVITFPPSPAGSQGCQLRFDLDPAVAFLNHTGGNSTIQVVQLFGLGSVYRLSWNRVVNQDPPMTGLVSGTAAAAAGVCLVLNTYGCSNAPEGTGLAFMFKLADSVEAAGTVANVTFQMAPGASRNTNILIDYDC